MKTMMKQQIIVKAHIAPVIPIVKVVEVKSFASPERNSVEFLNIKHAHVLKEQCGTDDSTNSISLL